MPAKSLNVALIGYKFMGKAHSQACDDANPSAGYIAWLLWGGDPGKKWVEAEKAKLGKERRN